MRCSINRLVKLTKNRTTGRNAYAGSHQCMVNIFTGLVQGLSPHQPGCFHQAIDAVDIGFTKLATVGIGR